MLSCRAVEEPQEALFSGSTAHWVLHNDGNVAWPEGTTLRLVGGPVVATPVMEMPPASPGQSVIVDLEVLMPESSHVDIVESHYALVLPWNQPFGDLLVVRVTTPQVKKEEPKPQCLVIAAPCDGHDEGLEGLQGELKTLEWTLANTGPVAWPADAEVRLIFGTPGFAHLPEAMEIPKDVLPGMTVKVTVQVLMPETEGHFKAVWAVTSPSVPEFGELLLADFEVSDFPFMEWMLADAGRAECVSELSTDDVEEVKETPKLSASMRMHCHRLPYPGEVTYKNEETPGFASLGCVSELPHGCPWMLEVAVENDGNLTWPAGVNMTCCFGNDMGCSKVAVEGPEGCMKAGDVAVLRLPLTVPAGAAQGAWVLATGDTAFGPVFHLEVQ